MAKTNTSPTLDRLLSWSLRQTLPTPLRVAVTTALIVAVGLVRVLFMPAIVPWLFFIPVVLAVALLFGRAFGVYASVLAAVVAGNSIGNAHEPLWLTAPQWIGSIAFLLVTSGIAFLAGEMRSVFARATQLTAALAFEQATFGRLGRCRGARDLAADRRGGGDRASRAGRRCSDRAPYPRSRARHTRRTGSCRHGKATMSHQQKAASS